MEKLLKEFEDKDPEIVYEWRDSKTKATGWLVINSLRGGAAAGGTRIRSGVTKEEVCEITKRHERYVLPEALTKNYVFDNMLF